MSQKNSVLFVITNINGTHNNTYSFGLASLASVIKENGIEYDYSVIETLKDYESFFNIVEEMKPKVIAYSSVSSQFMFIKELSQVIRGKYGNNIMQVCGGVHATIFPQCLFEANSLDGIFIGEGEYALLDFLNKVSRGLPHKDTRNFAYIDNGRLVKNELYPLITDLDALPFPEREKYKYENIIEKNGGYGIFIFNRGCPYLCTYCSNHALAKVYGMTANKPRFRSPERCIEEINKVVKRYSPPMVYIGDDTFGLNKKWAEEFLLKYGERIKLPFMCQLRVNLVDEDLVRWLKDAGCTNVACGIESGNDYIRNTIMGRNVSEGQIVNAYALFRKYKILANSWNMIGMPHETMDNIKDTLRLNRKINPYESGAQIFYPYKGTKLGDYCFEKGLVDIDAYDSFSAERRESVLNFSPKFKTYLAYVRVNWNLLISWDKPAKFIYIFIRQHVQKKMPHIFNAIRLIKQYVIRGFLYFKKDIIRQI